MSRRLALAIGRGTFVFVVMSFNGLTCIFLYGISLGRLRRFNHEWVSVFFCRVILRGLGIKLVIKGKPTTRSVMYIFNHNSYLDLFLIPSLRLKRTRMIISTRTKKILPLYLCNLGIGSFFIPFKDQPARRLDFFHQITKFLVCRNESVICAPEGVHTFRNEIGKFNRGVFHAAMNARIDLHPIYVAIPPRSNPLESYHFESGRVTISFLDPISTRDWKLENLDHHIAEVRSRFLAENSKLGASMPQVVHA